MKTILGAVDIIKSIETLSLEDIEFLINVISNKIDDQIKHRLLEMSPEVTCMVGVRNRLDIVSIMLLQAREIKNA